MVGITGELRYFATCSKCDNKNLEDLFFATCTAALDDEIAGCTNCIRADVGNDYDFCNSAKPIVVCLEQACDETSPGHEYILRKWLEDQYQYSEDAAVLELFRCDWTFGIYIIPKSYNHLLTTITAEE